MHVQYSTNANLVISFPVAIIKYLLIAHIAQWRNFETDRVYIYIYVQYIYIHIILWINEYVKFGIVKVTTKFCARNACVH